MLVFDDEPPKGMSRWKVTYRSKTDGDCCSVWVYAESRDDAECETVNEYWDVADILMVEKLQA